MRCVTAKVDPTRAGQQDHGVEMTRRLGKVLLLGKRDDHYCERALERLLQSADEVRYQFGTWGESLDPELNAWSCDYLISYLGRWIVPATMIERVQVAAINFHPGSPHYPGVGCVNFAIWEEARDFGATCHHLAEKVDSGPIIAVERFDMPKSPTVAQVLELTYAAQWKLFRRVIDELEQGLPLPSSDEHWTRRPFTRKDLNELSQINIVDPDGALERQVRATSFGKYQPSINIGGVHFQRITGQESE